MRSSHTHPKDCPDQKAAAADRAKRAAATKRREERLLVRARVTWFGVGLRS
jgi:hypothetical protein